MESRFIIAFFVYFQVAQSQYYGVPATSYPSYSYNYYSSIPTAPTFGPTIPNVKPSPTKTPKRSAPAPPAVKCSPQTASAYFLSTPSEKVKATVLPKEKFKAAVIPKEKLKESSILAPTYSCPLCNNFADVTPNPKIPPPPPIGCSMLPEILEKIPTITIPKDLTTKDPKLVLSQETPLFSDMYEKHKIPKNLSFDQELLEGFLTGLGIAL